MERIDSDERIGSHLHIPDHPNSWKPILVIVSG